MATTRDEIRTAYDKLISAAEGLKLGINDIVDGHEAYGEIVLILAGLKHVVENRVLEKAQSIKDYAPMRVLEMQENLNRSVSVHERTGIIAVLAGTPLERLPKQQISSVVQEIATLKKNYDELFSSMEGLGGDKTEEWQPVTNRPALGASEQAVVDLMTLWDQKRDVNALKKAFEAVKSIHDAVTYADDNA